MKIAVVGAGAMGSIFGARFRAGGTTPCSSTWSPPLVETINAEGVTVVRGEEETVTRVLRRPIRRRSAPVDIVVFFTKCYHTAGGGRERATARRSGHGRRVAPERLGQRRRARGGVPAGAGRRRGHVQQRSAPGAGRVVHPADQPTIVGSFADGGPTAPARLARGARRTGARGDGRLARAAGDLEEADPQRGDVARRRR